MYQPSKCFTLHSPLRFELRLHCHICGGYTVPCWVPTALSVAVRMKIRHWNTVCQSHSVRLRPSNDSITRLWACCLAFMWYLELAGCMPIMTCMDFLFLWIFEKETHGGYAITCIFHVSIQELLLTAFQCSCVDKTRECKLRTVIGRAYSWGSYSIVLWS
jgi:hypothetical protein